MHRVAATRASALALMCVLSAMPFAASAQSSTPSLQTPRSRHLDPPSLPPPAGYAHVVIAPAGRIVAISGQVALDADGKVVGAGNFEAQCVQVFENLKVALGSVGLDFSDVIRTDMYVTDLGHLARLRDVRARYLRADALPASTLVKVDALVRPELMIEISVDAVLPDGRALPAAIPPPQAPAPAR